jgi:hypothetical protein
MKRRTSAAAPAPAPAPVDDEEVEEAAVVPEAELAADVSPDEPPPLPPHLAQVVGKKVTFPVQKGHSIKVSGVVAGIASIQDCICKIAVQHRHGEKFVTAHIDELVMADDEVAEEAAPAPVDDEEVEEVEEGAPAPVDEEVAAAERLASQSGLRVGATIKKKFPGYGVHRGTVVELGAASVVVNWETDERTTLSIKEASRRVIEEAEEASSAPAPAPVVEEVAPAPAPTPVDEDLENEEGAPAPVDEAAEEAVPAPAPAPVVEEAAAAEEAAPATVDEEVAEAVPAPAPAPGGEEPPQLREGGYAFENSTGRMVMVRLVKGLRERNGFEWWSVQPLGGGSPRTVGRFRLVPCAPPAPRR